MNFSHLRYLVEVERCGSITKAAQALYMGQPNLSKAIKEMENEFGVPIFRRSAKGVVPTEKGRELLVYAKAILAQVEKMEAVSKSDDQSLVEFSLLLPRASYISHAFTLFLRELGSAGKMNIKLKETNSASTIDLVADCEYDLGIIRYPLSYEAFFLSAVEERGLKARELWTFDYVVLMSQKSPLARAYELTESMLEDRIEILHGDNIVPNLTPSLSRSPAVPEGQKRIYVYERGSQFDILSTVQDSYMWVSPLPREVLHRYGLVQKPCADLKLTHRDVLLSQSSYRFTRNDKLFLEILDDVRRGIIV